MSSKEGKRGGGGIKDIAELQDISGICFSSVESLMVNLIIKVNLIVESSIRKENNKA